MNWVDVLVYQHRHSELGMRVDVGKDSEVRKRQMKGNTWQPILAPFPGAGSDLKAPSVARAFLLGAGN